MKSPLAVADEHLADGSGQRTRVADPLVPKVENARIMPVTVPSRPIMGVHTPITGQ